jgi:hypothetical protein
MSTVFGIDLPNGMEKACDIETSIYDFKGKILRKKWFGVWTEAEGDALKNIARMLDRGNDVSAFRCYDVEEFDRLLDGKATEEDFDSFLQPDWWWEFRDTLAWWEDVAGHLLENNRYDCSPDPLFAQQRAELFRLLNDVYCAYVPHIREQLKYDDRDVTMLGGTYEEHAARWYSASLELLKRYGLYTRYVRAFAQELFPSTLSGYGDVNLAPLLERA